jgi:hypothetical protein
LRLASGSSDKTVRIWDAETEGLQRTLEGHTSYVRSMVFSHDEQWLASGSDDATVQIWDSKTGRLRQTLKGHKAPINSVAFSQGGRRLASGSHDATVLIWDTGTGVLQRTLEGHRSFVMSVAFSHNGRRLASGSADETVRIWDAETGVLQQTLEIGTSISAISFSSDEGNLITELGCIALNQTPNWSGYGLHPNRSWITRNGKKILWLPPEYRPLSSIIRDHTIAIGCASGRVLLIVMFPLEAGGRPRSGAVSTLSDGFSERGIRAQWPFLHRESTNEWWEDDRHYMDLPDDIRRKLDEFMKDK